MRKKMSRGLKFEEKQEKSKIDRNLSTRDSEASYGPARDVAMINRPTARAMFFRAKAWLRQRFTEVTDFIDQIWDGGGFLNRLRGMRNTKKHQGGRCEAPS